MTSDQLRNSMYNRIFKQFLPVLTFLLVLPSAVSHESASLTEEDTEQGYQHVNTQEVPYQLVEVPEIDAQIPIKPLIDDPETGMTVVKLVYEAGFTNTWHTHNCAHGFYVLDGVLNTSKGDFSPGEFIWFPEGELMFHGATENNSVTALFITNKPFDITYPQEDLDKK